MCERALSVLGCSYANDVLHDAPYVISSDMISALHIDIVAEVPSLTPSFSDSTNAGANLTAPCQTPQSNLIAPSQTSHLNVTALGACEVPIREGKHRWLSPPSCPLSSSHMILRSD